MITPILLLLLLTAVTIRLNLEHHRHPDPFHFTRAANLAHPAPGFARQG